MEKPSLKITEDLSSLSCIHCGINFAIPNEFHQARMRDHNKKIICPNGHIMFYPAKSHSDLEALVKKLEEDNKRLASENISLRAKLDQLEAAKSQ